MATTVRERAAKLLTSNKNHVRYLGILAFMALIVGIGVTAMLKQNGVAMTHTEVVLDCHVSGEVAHTHNADCYDDEGRLVCTLPERELHTHTDECYEETRTLACGLEESEGHQHTDACYDDEGNLACGLDESEGHRHTDACYEVTRELVCGLPELTEEHVHGPGCFVTVQVEDGDDPADGDGAAATDEEDALDGTGTEDGTGADDPAADADDTAAYDDPVDDEAAAEMPEQTFEHTFTQTDENGDEQPVLTVHVDAPAGALPAGSTMRAQWVEYEELTQKEQAALDDAVATETDGKVLQRQLVDIKFFDADDNEVEPKRKVMVTFTSELAQSRDKAVVVHLDDLTPEEQEAQQQALDEGKTAEEAEPERKAQVVDQLTDKTLEGREAELGSDQLAFDAGKFSTYVLNLTSLKHTMQANGETVTIVVEAPAAAGIPADATLNVTEIGDAGGYQDYLGQVSEVVPEENIQLARFFDITIVDGEGNEIQPSEPVTVRIELTDAPEGEDADSTVVHFPDDGGMDVVTATEDAGTTTFDAEGFSVYGVVYTVDFHYEVDGRSFELSIPGGGFASLRQLVEELGVAEGAGMTPDEFVSQVVDVQFSDPSLVWVGKVEQDTTVGELKQANGLQARPSADLTEEELAEADAQQLTAGDWALVSLQPFTSEEMLVVTMENGNQFVITVTDDQVSSFDNLVNNERYVLYIDDGENYYALDNQGNTVLVPDKDLDALSSDYLWRFSSQENGSSNYDNASSWLSGGNYLDVYWTNKDKPIVNAANSDNWIPIVTLVQHGDGFYFRDLNPDRTRPGYFGDYYRCRLLQDIYDANTDTHNLRTRFGDEYYRNNYVIIGDPYNGAAVIHVYKQGSSYTVTAQSNDETFGHVSYTSGTENLQTSSSHTTFDVKTSNNVEKNKAVPGTFTAIPENGYKFTGWEIIQINSWDSHTVTDWGEDASQESTTIHPTVDGNLILQANFAPEKLYPFTVTTNDEAMGTVGGGDENGRNLSGQTSFASTSGVVIDGTGTNAYELSAVQKPLHKFVAWELRDADGQLVQTINDQNIPAHSFNLTGDGMTLTAIFRKKTETEIDEGDIDTLLDSWKADMTSDFVGVDKTAHVHDAENRIYEIDLSASSGKWAVENDINLDFITDTSRSMYFPANLEYAKGTEQASSFRSLNNWLHDNGTIGETYYVISNDNTATMYTVHYESGEWKFRDASYYDYWTVDSTRSSYGVPDGLTASGQPLNGKTLTGVIYKSRTAPDSYRVKHAIPDSLTEYWSRLDYLYKAVMTATETLKTIDPQAAVHLTTFNKASKNEGWIVRSTDNPLTEEQIFSSSLTSVTPDGGTRQDKGLYTSRRGSDLNSSTNPDDTNGVGSRSPFADNTHRHYAILVTDGAPNGATWGNSNSNDGTIFGQANKLKAITDDNGNHLTLMTLGISLNFVSDDDATNLANISSDPSKYAKAANNGGQIVTAIEELVESMVARAAMRGTVTDTLDPAFYPVKADGTPITPGYYTMDGGSYTPSTNDTREYCRWEKDGETWKVTYYNQTFKWPTRDSNGNIVTNGWNQAFYAKVKEDFMGGNAVETNSVGSTTFTATHTLLMNSQGQVAENTKKQIVDNNNRPKPITKSDIPTPHVNVNQLTLTENNTEWKIYVQTGVEPLPQIKALYDNILVNEVVSSSMNNMIESKSAMLFNPASGADPETFYLKDVFGDSSTIDWATLTAAREEGDPPAYVDIPYSSQNYGHNTGYIRLTLTKDGDTANYADHSTSSNLNDVETYVLSAQFIPYTSSAMMDAHGEATDTHDHSYHTTPQQSPGAVQLSGKPSTNTHIIDLFVRGLGITKTNEDFSLGLPGAEFTVYRPATAEEIADSSNDIKTFEGDTGKYIFDRDLSFDESGVAFVNGVRSLTPPKTTYYLVETKAPDGYTMREDPIRVELEVTNEYTLLPVASGAQPVTQTTKPTSGMYNWLEKASLKMVSSYGVMRTTGSYDPTNPDTVYGHDPDPTSDYEVMYYRISNNPGVELPAAGGAGTTGLYAFGAGLILLGGATLVCRRRLAQAA